MGISLVHRPEEVLPTVGSEDPVVDPRYSDHCLEMILAVVGIDGPAVEYMFLGL